ncbi:MAG: hypothetical protein AB8B77_01935 [Alphaproteobacteria bacterium]
MQAPKIIAEAANITFLWKIKGLYFDELSILSLGFYYCLGFIIAWVLLSLTRRVPYAKLLAARSRACFYAFTRDFLLTRRKGCAALAATRSRGLKAFKQRGLKDSLRSHGACLTPNYWRPAVAGLKP